MVKIDPHYAKFQPIPALILGLGVIGSGWEILDGFRQPIALAICLPYILVGTILVRYASRWRQIEQRRWIAGDEEHQPPTPRAIEQPRPDEAALPLPYTIKVKSTWKAPIVCFFLLMLVSNSLVAWFLYKLPRTPSEPPDLYTGFMIILFACAVLVSALTAACLLRSGYQYLEVTEEVLRLPIASFKVEIAWKEATLFAIYPANRISQHEYPPVIYELSGPKTIVRWLRVRRDMPWFRKNHKPALPFDEYDRQMDALLSLIAAKTGLPLYDLRG